MIAPDLRGHGESPAPEGVYTIDEMADDVIERSTACISASRLCSGGCRWGDTWHCRSSCGIPNEFVRSDAHGYAGRGRFARGGRRAREATARTVLEAGSAAPIVEPMIGRLFSPLTREERPERVEPLRAVMAQTTARGIAGTLRGMAKTARPARRPRQDHGSHLVLVGEDDVITPPGLPSRSPKPSPVRGWRSLPRRATWPRMRTRRWPTP